MHHEYRSGFVVECLQDDEPNQDLDWVWAPPPHQCDVIHVIKLIMITLLRPCIIVKYKQEVDKANLGAFYVYVKEVEQLITVHPISEQNILLLCTCASSGIANKSCCGKRVAWSGPSSETLPNPNTHSPVYCGKKRRKWRSELRTFSLKRSTLFKNRICIVCARVSVWCSVTNNGIPIAY